MMNGEQGLRLPPLFNLFTDLLFTIPPFRGTMEERMIRFITALRAGGVRISLAESADAFRAVDSLGVQEREFFRLSLRSTLVKDAIQPACFRRTLPTLL
jgi:uncharacterized protein with von Willebrand factor type A (vWA) domain